MSPRRRVLRPSRALALAVLLTASVAGCGSEEEPTPSGPRPVLAQPSLPGVASGIRQEGQPRLVNLIVIGDRVSGVGEVVEIELGVPVRLTVTSDVADVLVVQGIGASAQLTVDEPVQLSFHADRAGEFPVVLSGDDRVLTRLRVS
jgi:hypothetical protein